MERASAGRRRWVAVGAVVVLGLPHKYEHRPDHSKGKEKNQRTRDCELRNFFSLMDDPAPLWACFDRGFHDASVNLVLAIHEATPGS